MLLYSVQTVHRQQLLKFSDWDIQSALLKRKGLLCSKLCLKIGIWLEEE